MGLWREVVGSAVIIFFSFSDTEILFLVKFHARNK